MASSTTRNRAQAPTTYAYQRIEQDIRERVRDGRLPAGSMLASRHNLAREYGVSLATAQQAIANLIADGTLEASDRRGTFVAQGGPAREAPIATGTLGIVATARIDTMVTPDVGSLWAQQAIRSVERAFSAAGGTIRFFDRFPESRGPYARGVDDPNAIPMAEAIRSLRADGAVALAVIGLCDGRDVSDEIVASVDIERVPVVYVSWHGTRPPLAQVYYDNKFAGYQAAQHLLRKGYERLVVLAPFAENWLTERIGGAYDAVRHAGLPPNRCQVYPESPFYGGYDTHCADTWAFEAAQRLFAAEGSVDFPATERIGIIAPNDFTAYAVMRAATEQGKTPGGDYGLIGFDDDPQSYSLGLTTVRPPIEEMGEEAGNVLLRALRGERRGVPDMPSLAGDPARLDGPADRTGPREPGPILMESRTEERLERQSPILLSRDEGKGETNLKGENDHEEVIQ